jgi:CubicO group peptidase (beta-lactamase class C family)
MSHILSHQAGLPGFVEPITMEQFYDWSTVTARLAGQTPLWEPGTKTAYHAMT